MSGPENGGGPDGGSAPRSKGGPKSASGPYDDIIDLPHHVSATRPQMPLANRAAQFSPFAALSGYDAAIEETGRLTDTRIELAEGSAADLDRKLGVLAGSVSSHPKVAVTHFRPDEKKEGGAYVTAIGEVKKIDEAERVLVLMSGERIAIADILDIEGALFDALVMDESSSDDTMQHDQ